MGGYWLSKKTGGYFVSMPACCGISPGSNPDISQKYKMGDISKEVASTI
jgi:hypothetical protein